MNPQVIVMRSGKFVFVTARCHPSHERRARGTTPGQARPTAVSRRSFRIFARDQRVDRMMRGDELRVRRIVDDLLLPGRVHERLDQFHDGVRVFGGDIARQTQGGLTVSIFGTIHPDIDIDVSPAISADDVRAIVDASAVPLSARPRPRARDSSDGAGGYRSTSPRQVFTATEGTEVFHRRKDGCDGPAEDRRSVKPPSSEAAPACWATRRRSASAASRGRSSRPTGSGRLP